MPEEQMFITVNCPKCKGAAVLSRVTKAVWCNNPNCEGLVAVLKDEQVKELFKDAS